MPDKPSITTTKPAIATSASGTDILNAAAAGEIRDSAAAPAPSVPRTQPAPTRPETTPAAAAPATETRSITLPVAYWQAFDTLAERAAVDVSTWLERNLRQYGR